MASPVPPKFFAFTSKSEARLREIVSDIGISLPFVPPNFPKDAIIHRTQALWDTGATNSVITQATAKTLGLKPIGVARAFHAGGENTVNVYLVNLYLPNNLIIPNIRVSECSDNAGKFGVIIGMDVITLGDFAVTNVGGKTTFSFRIPSLGIIDYEQELNQVTQQSKLSATSTIAKVGRNDKCPCGSEKKYKYCHGKGL
jgi:hypothetical protein